jgi:hypothetical protein
MRFFDEFVGSKNPPPPGWNPDEEARLRQLQLGVATPAEESDPSSCNDTTATSSTLSASLSTPLPGGDLGTPFGLDPRGAGARRRYFTFRYGRHASVFVIDSRQYATPLGREGKEVPQEERTKLGKEQLQHLLHWLKTTGTTFKFLASSVSWSSSPFKFVQDGWAAYTHERDLIFDFIVHHNITGVVLLSADLHWSAAFHLKRWNLHEVTVSPIQAFGLPIVLHPVEEEEVLFQSAWYMHMGGVQIYDPTQKDGLDRQESAATVDSSSAAGPYVNISVYRYMYGEPQVQHSLILHAKDTIPGPVQGAEKQEPEEKKDNGEQ